MNLSILSVAAARNVTFLGLHGWLFDGDGINGALMIASPEGVRYLYDQGCEEKAVADAMTLQSAAIRLKTGRAE